MNVEDVKKVLDLMIDKKQIDELIINLHQGARNIYENFSVNSLGFYENVVDELREKMAEAIANKLNNLNR